MAMFPYGNLANQLQYLTKQPCKIMTLLERHIS